MSLPEISVEQGTRSGLLDLTLGPRDGRTRLIKSQTRSPLQVQRVLYLDEQLPDMAFVTIANPSAGLLAGDDHTVRVHVAAGARTHVGTQAATKVFSMSDGYARQSVTCCVDDNGALEYLPEPIIPFRDARLEQFVTLTVADQGALIYGEVLAAGRVAHDESFTYSEIQSRLKVQRPTGDLLYYEAFALKPQQLNLQTQGIFGTQGATALATLIAVSPRADLSELVNPIMALTALDSGCSVGAALLPNGNGLIVKLLAPSSSDARRLLRSAWSQIRPRAIGAAPPTDRRH